MKIQTIQISLRRRTDKWFESFEFLDDVTLAVICIMACNLRESAGCALK